ncbi:hypothetical protein Tco_1103065 [Tanacetum coccineum]
MTGSQLHGNDTYDLLVKVMGMLGVKGTNSVAASNTNLLGVSNSPVAFHATISLPCFPSAGPNGFGHSYQTISHMQPTSYVQVPPGFSYTPAHVAYSPAQLIYPVVSPVQPSTSVGRVQGVYQAQPLVQPIAQALQLTQPAQPGSMPVTLGLVGPTAAPRQDTTLPHAFTTGTPYDPASSAWNFDTGASSHLNNSVNSLNENFNTCMYPSISVGDGHSIPVTNTGHSILPTPTKFLYLNNVLIIPHIVKNLIYVR